MNLKDQVLNLAEPLTKNKSLLSVSVDDNMIEHIDLADFCSRLGINRFITMETDKHRI
jgi:hypothetical protein